MTTVNKKIKLSAIIFFALMIIPFKGLIAQTNSFYVYFMQNNNRINIKDAKVELKKQPFKLFIEYTEPLDLYISSSYKAKTFNEAKSGKLLFSISAFDDLKSSESFFLNKGTINLFREKTTLWEKNKTDDTKIKKTEDGRFISYKNIDKIYSIKKENLISISNVEYDVHLVFIYAEKDKENNFQEIQRELVKIKWVENYDEDKKNYKRQQDQRIKARIKEKERSLKRKNKIEKKEEERLKKIEEHKLKEKEKDKKSLEKKAEKEKKKADKSKK